MFKGIVENIGIVESVEKKSGATFTINSSLAKSTQEGNSISINGVCTTVIQKTKQRFSFYASKETLALANLDYLQIGDQVNLESALKIGDTLDGHFVSGHVDKKIKVLKVEKKKESVIFSFPITSKDRRYLISKGSVCLNGISLTIYALRENYFSVMIIPYTYENTNLKKLTKGDWVNLEFDSMGKYFYNFYRYSK